MEECSFEKVRCDSCQGTYALKWLVSREKIIKSRVNYFKISIIARKIFFMLALDNIF